MFIYLTFENTVEVKLPLSYSLVEITSILNSLALISWPTPLGAYTLSKVEGLGRFDQLLNSALPLESRKIVTVEDALSVTTSASSFESLVGSSSLDLLYLLVTDYGAAVTDLSTIITTQYKGLWPTQEEYVRTAFSSSNPSCLPYIDYLDTAKYISSLKTSGTLYTVKASNATGYYIFDFS